VLNKKSFNQPTKIMKKNFKLLLLVGLAVSIGFTSCSEDEETVTPTPTPVVYGQINTYSAKLLGGQNNLAVGSFFSTSNGTVIGSVDAGASSTLQASVDFVYFYGTTNAASIGAPSDATVATAHNGSTTLANWTVKNSTKFVLTNLTPANFIGSMNDSLIKSIDTATVSTSLVTQLAVGKIVAFKTVGGKYGLFHVAAIGGDTGSNREITIDVKVQK
jgi:hypothetical protein